MKTWTELQEWVELEGDRAAAVAAKVTQEAGNLHEASHETVRQIAPEFEGLEHEVITDAVKAKAAEFLSNHYQALAEGWFESYYISLRRMYEEES